MKLSCAYRYAVGEIMGTDLGTEALTSNGMQNTDGYVSRH